MVVYGVLMCKTHSTISFNLAGMRCIAWSAGDTTVVIDRVECTWAPVFSATQTSESYTIG